MPELAVRPLGAEPGELANALPDHITGPAGVTFLPYLSGERTPHNDSAIRGAFVGLDIASDNAQLTQAVMEGVAFAMRDSLEALKATGADLKQVLAIGGGTRSRFWVETLATVLDLPMHLPKAGEFGAALGAARLAMAADGQGAADQLMTPPEVAEVISPQRPAGPI